MHYAIRDLLQTASGYIVDCSRLILNGVEKCEGAEGNVCFVDDFSNDALTWVVSRKAQAKGCIAIIFSAAYIFRDGYGCAIHSFADLSIPFVCVSHEDGRRVNGNNIGTKAIIEVGITGQACVNYMPFGNICSEKVACGEK